VLKIVDIAYGGENGFNQAIELSGDALRNVKFVHEKKIIGRFFEEIAKDSGKFSFGLKDTMDALEYGAVEILIIYENLEFNRLELKDIDNKVTYKILPKAQSQINKYRDESGIELEVVDNTPLTEWFLDNYKKYGSHLEIITDKSSEGNQFVKGFGGIGGILRYKMESTNNDAETEETFNEDDFI